MKENTFSNNSSLRSATRPDKHTPEKTDGLTYEEYCRKLKEERLREQGTDWLHDTLNHY